MIQQRPARMVEEHQRSGQRTYDRAITDFVEWYCSELRLAFNRTVVPRHRGYLEQKQYALTTITCAWPPADGSRRRPPIPACSVRSLQPGSEGQSSTPDWSLQIQTAILE